ncbi:RNase H family protein [Aureibacillus halotolerans]|uniref:Ribonuclease HI n=1 Tax=Aureibacillus halotolerans TaxID=1508390 RepID=A0A4R6U4S6_9BACI|nr:RNase H family protein [Aureibacillus halotolerans]TDQ41468.1 ribonuclease HI [Aureibacillus halotolerans]
MNIQIQWTYTKKGINDISFVSDFLDGKEVLKWLEDARRTGRMGSIELVDEQGRTWNEKNLKQYLQKESEAPSEVQGWFDGNFDKETHCAGLGIYITYTQQQRKHQLRKNRVLNELASNNEAEYAALWMLANELKDLNVMSDVTIHGDSMNVIHGMAKDWAIYDDVLQSWAERIDQNVQSLQVPIHWKLISSKENKRCDQLAEQALLGISIESHSSAD